MPLGVAQDTLQIKETHPLILKKISRLYLVGHEVDTVLPGDRARVNKSVRGHHAAVCISPLSFLSMHTISCP